MFRLNENALAELLYSEDDSGYGKLETLRIIKDIAIRSIMFFF